MPKPFKGKINLDIRDSTPDWSAYLADRAPEGSPNVLVVLYTPAFELTGGTIAKVMFDVADDAYVNVEAELAAALARD